MALCPTEEQALPLKKLGWLLPVMRSSRSDTAIAKVTVTELIIVIIVILLGERDGVNCNQNLYGNYMEEHKSMASWPLRAS